MEIVRLAVLVFLFTVGCAPGSAPAQNETAVATICVVDVGGGVRPPTSGAKMGSCLDSIDVKIDSASSEQIDDLFEVRLAVDAKSQAHLKAFLTNNLKKQAVLGVKDRALLNMFIMGSEAKELRFFVESKHEVDELYRSLATKPPNR